MYQAGDQRLFSVVTVPPPRVSEATLTVEGAATDAADAVGDVADGASDAATDAATATPTTAATTPAQ